MTQPDPQTNDQALPPQDEVTKILEEFATNVEVSRYAVEDGGRTIGHHVSALERYTAEAAAKLNALRVRDTRAALDRIADSVKQHTVPEGWDLADKSYVLNTIEFERGRASLQTGGKS